MDASAARLTSPNGELQATFLTRLGMIGASLIHRGEELLAQRGGPAAYATHGSTFGIPLLYPWANRLSAWNYPGPDGDVTLDPHSAVVHVDGATGLPSHGLLAADGHWTITRQEIDRLEAELNFAADPALLASFPFPHQLRFRAAVTDASLSVGLTVIPTSAEPVPISFGFHPYVTLPGSDRRSWTIEAPVRSRAVLDERGIPLGTHQAIEPGALDGPLGDRAFDDCFDELIHSATEPAVFSVADEHRRITITLERGYDVAQIYSPADANFICFEPMTAPVDALRTGRGLRVAQPGERFTADFTVAVAVE